jgi:hypothetical protein
MGVLENLKGLAELAQKVGQIELYKKILEAEDEVRELSREKRRLEDKVEELEGKLRLRAAMISKAPVYYQQGDATPFCAACFENNGRAVHRVWRYVDFSEKWFCDLCKNSYPENPESEGPAFGVVPMSRG